jgi:small subunit ribosomal protein S21
MVNKFNKAKKTFGLKVELDERLPFDKAIRLFKRKVEDSGILNEVKERMEYNKPSIHRKIAKGRAVKRWQKKQEKTHLEGKSKKY